MTLASNYMNGAGVQKDYKKAKDYGNDKAVFLWEQFELEKEL
ncbi:MAG: hypothetical protein RBR65_05855 [Aliarcobacter sp.]|jgi:hypothetical protein|nr:hypothetical protein [Aliarcobacter sp.]